MRPPEVFVRELSPRGGCAAEAISKRAKYQAKRQRAMIVLASATLMSAPEIARLMRTDESHVRKVIHAFNEEGFSSLDPDYRGGRPKKTTPCERDRIVAVARARPDTQGVPLTRWSLAKLAPHLAGMGILLSEEALRQLLIDAGLSHQRTRSWKWSPDPDFREGRACAGALQSQARRRRRRLLRRDGPDPADPPPRLGLGAPQATTSGCARPTSAPTACATCSPPMTCTQTGCTAACASTRTPARSSRSSADPDALRPQAADLPGDGQPLHAQDPGDPQNGPRTTTSSSSSRPPTRAS